MRSLQLATQWEERRAHQRVTLRAEIHFASASNFYTGFSRDISEGGVFVASYDLLPSGTRVDLELSLPDGDPPIAVAGEVRWVAVESERSDGHPGIGIKFLGLAESDRARIEHFVASRETVFYDD